MKKLILSASLLATGLVNAATPIDGWYTSAFGGFTYLPNNISTINSGVFLDASSYVTGYNVGGRVGYQSNPLRYEFEYTFLSSGLNGFNINSVSQANVSGSSSGSLLMANIYYDFPDMLPAMSPFLGVGIGGAILETTLISDSGYFHLDESQFAYQGTAGITYNFSENYSINLAYRYAAVANNDNYGMNFQAHMLSAGGTYHFDRGFYK